MDAIQAIMTRRSVRNYAPGAVTEAEVETMLRAAMAAPSAGNQQPWHFVVIRDRELREAITEVHPHAGMLPRAGLGIVVCGDREAEKYPGYWVQDCSAAMENLLLAAHALGLGAVWLGVHPMEERADGLRRLLGLPRTVEPLGIAAVGRRAETPSPADRYRKDRIHLERW